MTTDRERFLMALAYGPLLRVDAILVPCGEDASARLDVGYELFRHGGAEHIVLSGALHDPPHLEGAEALFPVLMGKGVAPSKIHLDNAARNTHEQAVNVVAMAVQEEWASLALAASPYHLPRLFLTFLRELQARELTDSLRLVPVGASQTKWWESPPGVTPTRLALFDGEMDKIDLYATDVATYAEGLAYLAAWEARTQRVAPA